MAGLMFPCLRKKRRDSKKKDMTGNKKKRKQEEGGEGKDEGMPEKKRSKGKRYC